MIYRINKLVKLTFIVRRVFILFVFIHYMQILLSVLSVHK
jgi:hypothetical protein